VARDPGIGPYVDAELDAMGATGDGGAYWHYGRDDGYGLVRARGPERRSEARARRGAGSSATGAGRRRRRAVVPQAEVWTARGDPMTEGAPFGLVGQLVCSAAGLLHGEPLATRQQKLRARVSRHIRGPSLKALLPFLGELAGTPFSDDDDERLRAARADVADQARAVAERHGTVSDMDAIHRIHCVEALWALGRKDEARAALREARDRLLALAAKLEDTPWRRSFLEQVSENARTLVRAGEWLV
jgi:hypothetical protein